jgi:hypothetical protein
MMMPLHHLLEMQQSFGPDEIETLAIAFEETLQELGLARTDRAANFVAKRIIVLAEQGEHDPARLRQGAVKDVQLWAGR